MNLHFTEEQYQQVIAKVRTELSPIDDIPDEGPESRLLSKCLSYCKERGFPAFHDRSRGKNQRGWPDLQIYLPGGKVVLIELKSETGTFKKEQQQLARQFMYLKHRYEKVRSYTKFLEIMEGQ
jgi:hypothetical protein